MSGFTCFFSPLFLLLSLFSAVRVTERNPRHSLSLDKAVDVWLSGLGHNRAFTPGRARAPKRPKGIYFLCEPASLGGEQKHSRFWAVWVPE